MDAKLPPSDGLEKCLALNFEDVVRYKRERSRQTSSQSTPTPELDLFKLTDLSNSKHHGYEAMYLGEKSRIQPRQQKIDTICMPLTEDRPTEDKASMKSMLLQMEQMKRRMDEMDPVLSNEIKQLKKSMMVLQAENHQIKAEVEMLSRFRNSRSQTSEHEELSNKRLIEENDRLKSQVRTLTEKVHHLINERIDVREQEIKFDNLELEF